MVPGCEGLKFLCLTMSLIHTREKPNQTPTAPASEEHMKLF